MHAVDFSYDCTGKLQHSFGFETYPARRKKPGRELVVLVPVFGKAGEYRTCDLKTDGKDFVYHRDSSGRMGAEPEQRFLQWMAHHNYDPVHGKDVPSQLPGRANAPQPAAPRE